MTQWSNGRAPLPLLLSFSKEVPALVVCPFPLQNTHGGCSKNHDSQRPWAQTDDAENLVITITARSYPPWVPTLRPSQAVLFLSPLFNLTSFQWLIFCRRQKEIGKQDYEAGVIASPSLEHSAADFPQKTTTVFSHLTCSCRILSLTHEGVESGSPPENLGGVSRITMAHVFVRLCRQ